MNLEESIDYLYERVLKFENICGDAAPLSLFAGFKIAAALLEGFKLL